MYILDESMAELVGIIIGDGCISCARNHYFVEIVGNPKDEGPFFDKIRDLTSKRIDKTPKITVRSRGLRLKIYSKAFVQYLIHVLHLPHGKGKNLLVQIPEPIEKNWRLAKACIRGIMDTDGSFFLARKGNNPHYPCLEITTTSRVLANQLRRLLTINGFRISTRVDARTPTPAFRIGIYGANMAQKWNSEIGFSNNKNIDKYRQYIETFK